MKSQLLLVLICMTASLLWGQDRIMTNDQLLAKKAFFVRHDIVLDTYHFGIPQLNLELSRAIRHHNKSTILGITGSVLLGSGIACGLAAKASSANSQSYVPVTSELDALSTAALGLSAFMFTLPAIPILITGGSHHKKMKDALRLSRVYMTYGSPN